MQALASRRRDRIEQRTADDGVTERHAVVVVDDHAGVARPLQQRQHVARPARRPVALGAESDGLLDDGHVEALSDDSGDAQHVHRLAEPGEPAADDLDEPDGHVLARPGPRVESARLVDEVVDELADEQRVARRPGPNGVTEGDRRRVEASRRSLHEGDDGGAVDAVQRDSADAVVAAQVGEHGGQRIGRPEIGVAVRADDRDVRDRGGDDSSQDAQRRRVDPVQIIDDEHRRPGVAQHGDDAVDDEGATASGSAA